MTILLILWVCISSVCCLAFLRVVANQVPTMDEQLVSGREVTSGKEPSVVLARASSPSLEGAFSPSGGAACGPPGFKLVKVTTCPLPGVEVSVAQV